MRIDCVLWSCDELGCQSKGPAETLSIVQTWSLALERLIFSQFMGNNQQEKETMPNSAILMKTEEKNWTLDRTLFDRTLFDRTLFRSVS